MTEPLRILYDGECPFCSAYVRMLRLRKSVGAVELIDARQPHPAVDRVRALGLDLNQGMVVLMNGEVLHGDAAMHRLALLSGPSATLNAAFAWLFRDPGRARRVYPALRAGRNLALRLLGRQPIPADLRAVPAPAPPE